MPPRCCFNSRSHASHARLPAQLDLPESASVAQVRSMHAFVTGSGLGAVDAQAFCALMDEVLTRRRGPRAYLAPSPPPRYQPEEMFHPCITERSKQLAARMRPKVRASGCWLPYAGCWIDDMRWMQSRVPHSAGLTASTYACRPMHMCCPTPQDTPVYEVLHSQASTISAKLAVKRAAQAGNELQGCTFAPKLVAHPVVSEGRVMQVRRAMDGLPRVHFHCSA